MSSSQSGPSALLHEGAKVLAQVLGPHGFAFREGEAGNSSGGSFAAGSFVNGDHAIKFSVRHGLGHVVYRLRNEEITHEEFLRYSGAWGKHKYPDFGASTAASFAALAHDLQALFGNFLSGDSAEFESILALRRAEPNKFTGFAALGRRDG